MAKRESKLDGKIDDIIQMIIDGETYRVIADKYKVALSTLHAHLSKDEHSARTREALDYSASTYADKAEKVLKNISKESVQIEMHRARELAQHYRWKAGKRAPKKYGERVQTEHSGSVAITPVTGIEVK